MRQNWKLFGMSTLLTLVVWLVFSWPLPLYVTKGIPSSSSNTELKSYRAMMPGDHLQMLYHHWLVSDQIAGKTPFWYNLYEFNTGDDAALKYVGGDYYPMGLVFALGERMAGQAFGWNLMGLLSLFITTWFSFLLLQDMIRNKALLVLLSVFPVLIPYRWTMLLGGSPTGYAACWVPMYLWGLDRLFRKQSLVGGLTAGLAILFSMWNDSHIFFFNVIFTPFWMLIILARWKDLNLKSSRFWKRMLIALIPVFIGTGIIATRYIKEHLDRQENTQEELTVQHGRTLEEVGLYSPEAKGLIQWRTSGKENSVYLGFLPGLILLAGLSLATWLTIKDRRKNWRQLVILLLLSGFCLIVVLLALGVNGPGKALPLRAARSLIPPYNMIRQPAKIFPLMAPVLALGLALSLQLLFDAIKTRKYAQWLYIIPALFIFEYAAQVRACVCLIDQEQGAYKAVADDARSRYMDPHVLIIPLWPGDSAWASLYEYYCSLYRIRMINGYQPVIMQDYLRDVVEYFDSANAGLLSDAQLANLKERGIEYIVLHEDAFPEQVSVHPVSFTLKNLMEHPRLELLAQDGPIWSFRIHDTPLPHIENPVAHWKFFLPSNYAYREAEHFASNQEREEMSDDDASAGHFLQISEAYPIYDLEPYILRGAPNPNLMLRMRGPGLAKLTFTYQDGSSKEEIISSRNNHWNWVSIPLNPPTPLETAKIKVQYVDGTIDFDELIFAAGAMPELDSGEHFDLPAALFFHAGYTDLADDSVVIRPEREPNSRIWYGPKLPLLPGSYRCSFIFESTAKSGTKLGRFNVEQNGRELAAEDVITGNDCQVQFNTQSNFAIEFGFLYDRSAALRIKKIRLERM